MSAVPAGLGWSFVGHDEQNGFHVATWSHGPTSTRVVSSLAGGQQVITVADRPTQAQVDLARCAFGMLGAIEDVHVTDEARHFYLTIDVGVTMHLADPTGQIERECALPEMKQRDVAQTYALAIRDQAIVPVDWARANAAIRARWPKGLERVKVAAWKTLKEMGTMHSESK